jgi:uncharacterized protein YggE
MIHRLIFPLCLMATTAVAQPAQAPQSPGPPVVVTTGEGSIKRAPDRAWVTIAAESRAKTAREAQQLNADAMSAVMQKLKGLSLAADAIKTIAYDLQPEFDFHEGRRTLRGYVARNVVEVRVDEMTRLGQVLEQAVGAGATHVSGVRFDLKDRAVVEREALALAITDARARADAAARAAGTSVDRIIRIEEHRGSIDSPRPMVMAMRQSAVAEPPITPGELEISVGVTLTAAIK